MTGKRLWNVFDGEPFLDNPYLTMFANPKGVKTMAHRSKATGRFVKGKARGKTKSRRVIRLRKGGAALINKRRAPKRRTFARVRRGQRAVILNPRRRRSYRGNPVRRHRRSYRHNPATFAGLMSMPVLKTIGLTAGGFVAVPLIEGFVSTYLPASVKSSKITGYVVKIASVIGLSMLVGKFLGREAGQKVAIGGGTYVALVVLKDLMPTFTQLPTITPGTMGSYLRAQPMLGAYQRGYMGSPITNSAPARLQPQGRY
jgi:hypothetical protein